VLSLDADRLEGDAAAGTQGVLSKIKGGRYSLSLTGVTIDDLTDLASNSHVVSFTVSDSSSNIQAGLDTLFRLGSKLTTIQQTDGDGVLQLTQGALDTRSSVLSKIEGGYTVTLTGVTAARAVADATNSHVAGMDVTDSGKNLAKYWDGLVSLGGVLQGVSQTDSAALNISIAQYLSALQADFSSKFDSSPAFNVSGASVTQATEICEDDGVAHIDVTDEGSAVGDNLDDLNTLQSAGKLHSIQLSLSNNISIDATQLDGAQPVLDLIKGGSYTLSVQN